MACDVFDGLIDAVDNTDSEFIIQPFVFIVVFGGFLKQGICAFEGVECLVVGIDGHVLFGQPVA